MSLAVSFEDIVAAAKRIEGVAVKTPLLENAALNERVGGRVFLKPETLQHAGAFKFRGAYNRLVQLSDEERLKGVVAWSSGNHAQGIAAAAKRLGIRATIIMPEDAPRIKVENTKRLGAQIHFYDRQTESREDIGHEMAKQRGATLVPSYDDPHIIAGQGTVGLEILEQAAELYVDLDAVFIPCGGGGLCAGSSLAIRSQTSGTEVFLVEPEGFDDTTRSLVSGKQEQIDKNSVSICDALLAPFPGDMTFPINKTYVTAGISVGENDIRNAIQFAWEHLKLVVEPGGVVALAALLSGKYECVDKVMAVVLSGGNVDAELYSDCILNF
ncbi:MAG: pyridoxal-5'-phosphate-dependent protein [Robiginitomaculum sp.]|nr:MAG: pyridoxal-5'-phosphate-dependent protein [Robiginitomaculum sp.]